jgi:hypothetical protein
MLYNFMLLKKLKLLDSTRENSLLLLNLKKLKIKIIFNFYKNYFNNKLIKFNDYSIFLKNKKKFNLI